MDLIQFISFVVVMLAMSLLSRKRAKEKQQAQYPETQDVDAHKQKVNLKKFLKSLEMDMEEDEEEDHEHSPQVEHHPVKVHQEPPPAPVPLRSSRAQPSHRLVKESTYQFQDNLEDYTLSTSIENKKWRTSIDNLDKEFSSRDVVSTDLQAANAYKISIKTHSSIARNLVQRIPSRKEMFIYHEIISPPLSVRPPRY
jgi:hypothetical protein